MSEQNQSKLDLNDDDVIQFQGNCLVKVKRCEEVAKSQINEAIYKSLSNQQIHVPKHSNWIGSGVPCELLKVDSQGWIKGTVRIKFEIEFIPDELEITEPESPLDDIRKEINQS